MSAKDRKRKEKAKPVGRRASPVKSYTISGKRKADPDKPARSAAYNMLMMGSPKGLSVEARFMDVKPKEVPRIYWWRLFTPDEDLWEDLQIEAVAAVEAGEKIDG